MDEGRIHYFRKHFNNTLPLPKRESGVGSRESGVGSLGKPTITH
ncbi:MAG TPA: hypothetical protein V6D48_14205 [Oculatellaceae cyanobacterium]